MVKEKQDPEHIIAQVRALRFVETVKEFFAFLETDFDFKLAECRRYDGWGNYDGLVYKSDLITVSIFQDWRGNYVVYNLAENAAYNKDYPSSSQRDFAVVAAILGPSDESDDYPCGSDAANTADEVRAYIGKIAAYTKKYFAPALRGDKPAWDKINAEDLRRNRLYNLEIFRSQAEDCWKAKDYEGCLRNYAEVQEFGELTEEERKRLAFIKTKLN